MNFYKYYIAALAAFVIWGFFSLVLKPLEVYPSLDILFYRVFSCAILMLIISCFFRRTVGRQNREIFKAMPLAQKRKIVWLTLGGGVFLTTNWFSFIYVMNHISIKAASFAYMICPIITTVLAFFILQEKLSRWQWGAVLLSVFSCILLSFNNLSDILYSLIVAISYALYLVSQRKNSELDKFLLLTFQIVFSALILLPFYSPYRGPLPVGSFFWGSILLIAVLFTIIPLFLNLYALKGVNSSTMGILLYINPVFNFGLAIFYFHESIRGIQIIAYCLILLSILIFNERHIFRRAKSPASPTYSSSDTR
ncbi:MAG TPA: EamA family transporter [Puia sp.]|nr:EamA family transporter [Puia sp.]